MSHDYSSKLSGFQFHRILCLCVVGKLVKYVLMALNVLPVHFEHKPALTYGSIAELRSCFSVKTAFEPPAHCNRG